MPRGRVMLHLLAVFPLIIQLFGYAEPLIAQVPAAASSAVAPPSPTQTPVTIRSITVVVREIFDGPDVSGIYQTANSLKVNTREEVVRRELLFKEGEKYDQFLVDESARVLRRFSFIGNVEIIPTFDGLFVDILVRVRDNWTLIPQVSLSLGGGGTDKKSIGLAEGNVLGFGKRAEVLFADDEGRQKIEGVYDDPRLMGTFQRLLAGYFDRSDGYRYVGFYGRPFRTLVDDSAWSTFTDYSNLVGRLFEGGDERYIFRQKHHQFGGRHTWALGDPQDDLKRISLGYEYNRDNFIQATDEDFEDIDIDIEEELRDPEQLPEDRKFSGPFVAYEFIKADYISMNYVDRFEWTEDYNLGTEVSARADIAPEVFGSEGDQLLLNAVARKGVRFGPKEFIRSELGASSRVWYDEVENTLIRGEWKYYNILGSQYLWGYFMGSHTLASSINLDYGIDLDRDREFLSGASTGLRGYEDRTFTGDKRFIANFEDRFHLIDNIFNFVSLGGAVFADIGGSTYRPLGRLFTSELYSNVGIGLRIGFPKSSGGGVARVDLAFPLRSDPEDGSTFEPRLLFSVGQTFSAKLRSEQVGIERANVTIGQDR